MAKRFYESMFLVDSNWANSNWQECTDTVTAIVEKYNGSVRRLERWADRQLKYPIKIERTIHRRGTYILTALEMPTEAPNQVQREVRLDPRFLRALFVIRRDDEIEKIFDKFPEIDSYRRRGDGEGEDGEEARGGDGDDGDDHSED